MHRWYVAAVVLAVVSFVGADNAAAGQAQPPAFKLDGDIALWTVAIKPDKTQEFEQILGKLRDALAKSADPARREQLAGWKVMRVKSPLPDGNVAYVHIINPVVAGADYNIMQALYDEFPEEKQALYELYRGAFVANLSLAPGTVALDMKKAGEAAASQSQ